MLTKHDTKPGSAPGTSVFGHPAIDCDIHPAVPNIKALMPYLDDYWREQFVERGIDKLPFTLSCDPPNTPLAARPDWRPQGGALPGSNFDMLTSQALDAFGSSIAIANCLHGAVALHSDDMTAVLSHAVNEWLARQWLDRDPRLRASIVIPLENTELAVDEIEARAADKRFVAVLMLAMLERPLGKRSFWPIYAAAERHDLPIMVHAGSLYRSAPTSIGWPSYFLEDYVNQSAAFESQLLSLISEGVFVKFPNLKVVFAEAGFCWLPAFIWRANKAWRGIHTEVPWVKEHPSGIVRRHVRFTLQPIDEPPDDSQLEQVIEQVRCDDLFLFSTDYPHWQFDGLDAVPKAFGPIARKMLWDNPLATFPRLKETLG